MHRLQESHKAAVPNAKSAHLQTYEQVFGSPHVPLQLSQSAFKDQLTHSCAAQCCPQSLCLCCYHGTTPDFGVHVRQAPVEWCGKGFRVLGLAHGKLRPESKHLLAEQLSIDNLKQHMYDTRLLGFSVITNALRNDTKAAIAELQERYYDATCDAVMHLFPMLCRWLLCNFAWLLCYLALPCAFTSAAYRLSRPDTRPVRSVSSCM